MLVDIEAGHASGTDADFKCAICLESTPVLDRAVLKGCDRDAHSCCAGCLAQHLQVKISEGRVDELRCPCSGSDGCTAVAADEEIAKWLDAAAVAKLARFRRLRADPDLRECPQCQHVCEPKRNGPRLVLEMTCPRCDCHFCHAHSKAHPPGRDACREHARNDAALLVADCKPCPCCGIATVRVEGCVRMRCRCGANWCWGCGRQIEAVGWHYNPANPSACTLNGSQRNADGCCLPVVCRVLTIPVVLVSGCVVLAFAAANFLLKAVLLLLFLPCYLCEPGFRCHKDVANVVTIFGAGPILLLLLPLAWGLLLTPLYGLLACFGANQSHWRLMADVPQRFFGLLLETTMFEGLPPPREGA